MRDGGTLTTPANADPREAQLFNIPWTIDSNTIHATETEGEAPNYERKEIAPPASMEEEKRTEQVAEPITLAAVMDLPLDILYEIFKHVHPADLLHLTQANKSLRYTLLCPGAKGVWQHSFRTADDPRIPPCLDNKLSLPQYANLIYGEGCFGCGSTSNVHDLFMFLDKRCHACIFKKYHILSNRGRFAPFDLGHGYPGRMARWTTIAKGAP
ncbi:hypothetical protein EV122DRAFT_274025 [Schizophyllum commune]